jgi:hypothetical protein
MTRKRTFTNEQLVTAMMEVAAEGGTRQDVVTAMGLDERKGYSNITQRIKHLKEAAEREGVELNLPELQPGKRGARLSKSHLEGLAQLVEESADAPVA